MTMKKRSFPRGSSLFARALVVCILVTAGLIALMLGQSSWGDAVRILCGFYTVATGLFFLAQIYGFIISQTQYSEAVEAPKFAMLEREEEEWRR